MNKIPKLEILSVYFENEISNPLTIKKHYIEINLNNGQIATISLINNK